MKTTDITIPSKTCGNCDCDCESKIDTLISLVTSLNDAMNERFDSLEEKVSDLNDGTGLGFGIED